MSAHTMIGPTMFALAQTASGLALVAAFALLAVRQPGSARIALAAQALATAITALTSGHILLAIPPLVVTAGTWLALPRFTPFHPAPPHLIQPHLALPHAPRPQPALASMYRGLAAAAVLTILCLPLGPHAIPLAVILLAIVLAASRPRAPEPLLALAALSNGLILTASLASAPAHTTPWLATAAVLLPLPYALPALLPTITRRHGTSARRLGEIDLGIALALALGSLAIPAGLVHLPLNPFAAIFAPLFGLDAVLRAWQRLPRRLPLSSRAVALCASAATILAVCPGNPVLAWIAVLIAVTAGLLPTISRRQQDVAVALCGAGLMLFGLIQSTATPALGDFGFLVGAGMAAAIVPDLAAVLAVLVLGHVAGATAPLPANLAAILASHLATGGASLVGLALCAALLWQRRGQPASAHLLHLAQAALSVLALSLGTDNGRFAALILLILLVLTRSAARPSATFRSAPTSSTHSAATETATPPIISSLAGLPPLGVFPGVALVVLAIAAQAPWLLLPVALCLLPILYAALPRRMSLPSATDPAWIPLALALFLGYAAPDDFIRWCHALTMVARP